MAGVGVSPAEAGDPGPGLPRVHRHQGRAETVRVGAAGYNHHQTTQTGMYKYIWFKGVFTGT